MDRNKTAAFTGHRSLREHQIAHITKRLKIEIEKLIEQGVDTFLSGGARGFDSIAAAMVVTLKEQYPNIKLVLVLPCPDHTKFWNEREIKFYSEFMKEADEIVCTSDHYFSGAPHVRNRWMIDRSTYCICYLTEKTGGTAYTAAYAVEKGLTVINIAEM